MFCFSSFWQKVFSAAAVSFPVRVTCETRLTENGISPEPSLLSLCSLSWKKAYIDPNRFGTTSRSRKRTPCVCIPQSCACIFVILQPKFHWKERFNMKNTNTAGCDRHNILAPATRYQVQSSRACKKYTNMYMSWRHQASMGTTVLTLDATYDKDTQHYSKKKEKKKTYLVRT